MQGTACSCACLWMGLCLPLLHSLPQLQLSPPLLLLLPSLPLVLLPSLGCLSASLLLLMGMQLQCRAGWGLRRLLPRADVSALRHA